MKCVLSSLEWSSTEEVTIIYHYSLFPSHDDSLKAGLRTKDSQSCQLSTTTTSFIFELLVTILHFIR